MAYTSTNLVTDAVRFATQEHLAYSRAKFVVARWNSGLSAEIPNDGTDVGEGVTGAQVWLGITRAQELIADLEANSNAKLNTILALSNVTLPSE